MEEVLFRGKRFHTKEWLFGGCFVGNNSWIVAANATGKIDTTMVTPETVGQFIGLPDKNGKRIFEGDVLRGKGQRTFVIQYNADITSYVAKPTDDGLSSPGLNYGTMQYYEVIGNIHDNPELLPQE